MQVGRDDLEAAAAALQLSDLEVAQPLLNQLPFPILLIDSSTFAVEWMNREARRTYARTEGTCHAISHGHDRPCPNFGEECPLATAMESRSAATVYHAHRTVHDAALFRVTAVPIGDNRIVEFHIPLSESVSRDSTTGLYSRAFFQQMVLSELALLERMLKPFSVLMLDIDHFKGVNDSHGHAIGDRVLGLVGALISETARVADIGGRWGGEELVLFLPDTPMEGALALAERLRSGVTAIEVDTPAGVVGITVSIGVAADAAEAGFDIVMTRADEALYKAKSSGRNRVVGA